MWYRSGVVHDSTTPACLSKGQEKAAPRHHHRPSSPGSPSGQLCSASCWGGSLTAGTPGRANRRSKWLAAAGVGGGEQAGEGEGGILGGGI